MSISTSKMLGKLGKSVDGGSTELSEQSEAYDMPGLTLTPSPKKDKDMKNVLTNALGLSSSKNYSPMD